MIAKFAFALVVATVAGAVLAAPSPGERGAVAIVDERKITWAEVDAASSGKISALRRELLAAKRAALRALIEERLMEKGASEAGLAREEFYEREIAAKAGAVDESRVEEFYRKHRQDLTGDPASDKAAVRFYLARQARRERQKILLAELARRLGVERRPVGEGEWEGTKGALELARVAGVSVTNAMVEEKAKLKLYRLRGELAREALRQADRLVRAELLVQAARQQGIALAELRTRIAGAAARVTDADIDRYYREKMQAENPAAEKHPERIRAYLEFLAVQESEEDLVRRMREEVGVKILVREPEPVRLVVADAPWAPARGAPDAPVSLTVFYNYRCRYCREMLAIYARLAEDCGGRARLSLRHFLPQYDPVADDLARGAVCALGRGKFWQYHDQVLRARELPSRAEDVAGKLSLADDDFRRCVSSARAASSVERDSEAARLLGLDEAPALLINGRVFGGRQGIERLQTALRAELSSPQ